MAEDKKKEEIVVKAPPKSVTSAEKKAEKAIEKALEEERFGVLQISHKMGVFFSASLLSTGLLFLFVSLYVTITRQIGWIVISSETPLLGLALWVLVGIVNMVGGLLLMGSE